MVTTPPPNAPKTTTTHHLGALTVWTTWDGSIGPVEMHIIGPSGPGITARDLKSLRLGALAPPPPRVPDDLRVGLEALGASLRLSAPGRGAGRGVRLSARHLANVALFLALAREEGLQDPCSYMGDYSGAAKSTVQQWVDRARETGFFTRSTKGRNGGIYHGALTDKAIEVLRVH